MENILNDLTTWGVEANKINGNFATSGIVPKLISDIVQLDSFYASWDNVIAGNAAFSVIEINVVAGETVKNELYKSMDGTFLTVSYYFLQTGETVPVDVTANVLYGAYTPATSGKLYMNFYRNDAVAWTLGYFEGYNIIYNSNTLSYGKFKDLTNLNPKKVVWVGTSIPASGQYPDAVCEKLNYKLYKTAYGGSYITRPGNLALSATIAELVAEFGAGAGDLSYETKIIPYLNGVIDTADAIIFEHGYNDEVAIRTVDLITLATLDSDIDWTSVDRTTFIGAFNYLLKKIYEAKPDIKIIIVSHLENRSNTGTFGGYYGAIICHAQELIARHYNFTFIDVYNFLGWSKVVAMPNTSTFIADWNIAHGTAYFNYWVDGDGNISVFQYFCPDGTHPSSDLRNVANPKLENIYTKLISNLV